MTQKLKRWSFKIDFVGRRVDATFDDIFSSTDDDTNRDVSAIYLIYPPKSQTWKGRRSTWRTHSDAVRFVQFRWRLKRQKQSTIWKSCFELYYNTQNHKSFTPVGSGWSAEILPVIPFSASIACSESVTHSGWTWTSLAKHRFPPYMAL